MTMSDVPWFRIYSSDLLASNKLKRIATAIRKPLCLVRGAWIGLLCMANESPVRGRLMLTNAIQLTNQEIADGLGLPLRDTEVLLNWFRELDMIDANGCVVNWQSRQSDGAERTRKWRERRRGDVTCDVTRDMQCDVTRDNGCDVTCDMQCDVTRDNGCDVTCDMQCDVTRDIGCDISRDAACDVQCDGRTEQNRTEQNRHHVRAYARDDDGDVTCDVTRDANPDDIHRRIISVWEQVMRRPLTHHDLQWIDAWREDVGDNEVLEVFKICQHEQPAKNPRSYANAVFKNRAENPPPCEIDERAALDAEMDARGIPAHPPWETDPNWRPPEWTPEATNA